MIVNLGLFSYETMKETTAAFILQQSVFSEFPTLVIVQAF